MNFINEINDILWTYILIIMLLGCAVWFSIRTRFVQFRMLREMIVLLSESAGKGKQGEKHVSSFQAFAITIASRVGTGNLAGVATAIAIGGPGAVFWMWAIALLGASSAFIESTLAQLYKIRGKDSFVGGPAYYMKKGLKQPWMVMLFAVLISITFGFAFNSVQSNTICAAAEHAFGFNHMVLGGVLTALTLVIIFGGIRRIARVSSIIVPIMALGYVGLALVIVLLNITHLPEVISLIISHAFGWEQALDGGVGMALMQGIKRGLFSNEAGMGSAPNAAATANVTHPVKQGLVQMLSVFIDTLLVCSATAFMGLFSGVPITKEAAGAAYVQGAASAVFGGFGPLLITVCMLLFGFSTLIGNLYYVDNCIRFIHKGAPSQSFVHTFRIVCIAVVFIGAGMSMAAVWAIADILMAIMCFINIPACFILSKVAVNAMKDYQQQRDAGQIPVFKAASIGIDESTVQYWK